VVGMINLHYEMRVGEKSAATFVLRNDTVKLKQRQSDSTLYKHLQHTAVAISVFSK